MSFEFVKKESNGVIIIRPHLFEDNRGIYKKNFEKEIFISNGYNLDFTEWSDIYSNKGTIRGLHYQSECSQAKLLHVVKGAIYDVSVDLRKNSVTFGKWFGILLNESEHIQIYIPEGFAHGFLALEDNTIFSYQCTGKYIPEACGGIYYNDLDLAIDWPIEMVENVILSEKDRNAMSFKEYCINNNINI